MISFDFVPFHEVGDEIAPHVPRHYREMTEGDDYGEPRIDWRAYLAASHAGQLMVVTVRDDGKLVGYSAFTIGANPRYKHIIEADNNGIFLEKKYRGRISRLLMQKSDEYLQNLGVHQANYTLSDDRVGRMLPGYKSKYKVWSKTYGK